jgi:predicted AAA+ superfamily ATPase
MIQRKYVDKILPFLKKEKIIILKWARQVWKTTLMKTLQTHLDNTDKDSKTLFLYADKLENEEIFSSYTSFLNYLKYNHSFWEKYLYVFIDEFQFIKNAWLFLKNIFDEQKDKLQIIVSGSSSLEITKNTEFLTWRAVTFYIDKISFKEFYLYKENIDKLPDFSISSKNELNDFYNVSKSKLEKTFLEYLTFWWYPEVITTTDFEMKSIILSQIIQTYIEKDIIHFLHIENIKAFNNLIKLLSSTIWNLINVNELSNTLNISMQTTNKYLEILEWTFVFSKISPFFKNIRKEISKMPKVFVEDIWIKNYVLWEIESIWKKIDLWKETENFIYNELTKKFEKRQIYFYRTISKAEIDFVVEKSFEEQILIECKYRNKIWNIPVVMKNFEENYGVSKKIIITKDILNIQDNVFYIPACLFGFVEI